MEYVIKRNGQQVPYNRNKIKNAVKKAFEEIGKYTEDVQNKVIEDLINIIEKNNSNLQVEQIQDLVEEYLMSSNCKDVARAYIRYRYKKEVARNYQNDFMNAVGEKLRAENIQNQNANVDESSFGGRVGEAASLMTKKYALDFLISDMAKNNHLDNEIYIHDLDSYAVGSHNCLSIPFDDLLANGFNTRQTDVRPAQSVSTAFQLLAVIFQLQSLQQFGR